MPLERVYTRLSLGVPHLDHVIVGAADHPPAVILDTAHGGHVAHQDVQTLTAVDVPHTQCGITGTTHNPGMC